MIVINFKNYKTGKKALELAEKIQRYLPKAIVCVGFNDVERVCKKKLMVFTQYIGSKNARDLKKLGAVGSLLNHSEHRINFREIKEKLKECKKIKFKVIVCAGSVSEAKKIKRLKPWAIAYEDPNLIGTGKSITKYNGKEVEKFVKMLKGSKIIPLCGAGIGNLEDVLEAKRLGCKGILISSAIAKDKKPERFLKELKKSGI